MSNERTVETAANADLATFTLKIDGSEVSKTYHVMSVSVFKEANKIPFAKLVILDGDPATEDFEVSNEDLFIPGNELEILAGYHSDESTIYKGIIIKHSIRIRKEGSAMLIIECRDEVFKMARDTKSKYFLEMSDSDIAEEIIDGYGLDHEVEATDVVHDRIVQHDTSDWDFMITRMDSNGLFCVVDEGTINIIAPDLSQEPVVNLQYGATILELDAEMDGRNQYNGVKSFSWNPADQAIVEVEASEPEMNIGGDLSVDDLSQALGLDPYNIYHGGQWRDEDLQAIADAKLLKTRLSKTTGRVKCQGLATLKPGTVINIGGVGNRISGNYFVTGVFHSIVDGKWTSDIQFGTDPEWFSEKISKKTSSSRPFMPAVRGLQIGVVNKLEGDPDGEDRIQVKLPIIDPDDEGIWTRLACLDAGNERGIFFRPEEGDEVIVGFLDDDPGSPVVLGMLHSSANPTPEPISDDNHQKGIVTRSKMKLVFDDEKKSVVIETPNGNIFKMDEDEGAITMEDENGNKITMDSGGIVIESASDLQLKASGDVNVEGVNISHSAQSGFTAEGSASAEISSSATTTVKGSLVQIN